MGSPLEIYASVVLHSGCALTGEYHKWGECPAQRVFMRIARKHQHKLQSNGLTIGEWVKREEYEKYKKFYEEHDPTFCDQTFSYALVNNPAP